MIDDIVFPLPLAFGASGGPSRVVEIYTAASGREQRNSPHAQSRRRFDAGVGIKSLDDIHTLIAFFEARGGQLRGFRFRDPMDYKSSPPSEGIRPTDQSVGIGDGAVDRFILVKNYGDNAGQHTRRIAYPRFETLAVFVDGLAVPVTWDAEEKEVVLDTPPAIGAVITAGFEFDTPVRFDTPSLTLALQAFGAGQAAHIPLIEVTEYA
ncbi:DUF2460 domain-containing protein [Robiginitomaculum antarcticum]|uniref:DUF2460 domain-containing protein n=1 Tax=Robiginitomaculum antarcticum TaxID=437507 RepID=UPI00035EA281|nr:DUF2460 domain-containing protein [Robiginitomaculum antarcticum]